MRRRTERGQFTYLPTLRYRQVLEEMVRPERFELPTFWFVAFYSLLIRRDLRANQGACCDLVVTKIFAARPLNFSCLQAGRTHQDASKSCDD